MNGGERATVVISTKNRCDSLRVAVASVARQTVPLQTIVLDDGSEDGSSEMVRREFPAVELHRFERSEGYIAQRNRGAQLARAPVIVSIDDDAELVSPHTVAQTLDDFTDPRIGAVAIPYIDVRKAPDVLQRPPDREHVWVGYFFIGTAHAVRRDQFLRLGGYREVLQHFGEERDFCIRLLDAGSVVRLGRADPLHHHESPVRDPRRASFHRRRNDVLFALQNVPWPYMPAHLAGSAVSGVRIGRSERTLGLSLRGLVDGCRARYQGATRAPVQRRSYRLFRRLRAQAPVRLDAVAPVLEAITDGAASRLVQATSGPAMNRRGQEASR